MTVNPNRGVDASSDTPSNARLRPIKHADVTDMVRRAIEGAIIEGELSPGTLLVDRQLAQTFSVSRTPVRDALREIEPTGLIRRIERGTQVSWVVSEFRERDVRELFQLRRHLETMGLEEPPDGPLVEPLLRLSTFFDDMPLPLGPEFHASYIDRDRRFHMAFVELSGNQRAVGFYQIIESQIDRIRHFLATGYEGRMAQIVVEHTAICEAMARADVDATRSALVEHLFHGEDAMIAFARERGLLVRDR